MLVNPLRVNLPVIPGTRMLEDPLGLAGVYVLDPLEPQRHWWIQWMLAPVKGRALGGIRAKLVDSKGFITFCNQRDLEILLQHAKPDDWCEWTGKNYPTPGEGDWYGLCCDSEDLRDDLFEFECRTRDQNKEWPWLPAGLEYRRRVHYDYAYDMEELYTLLWDVNPDTGQYPDPTFERVQRRWAQVERTRVNWERIHE